MRLISDFELDLVAGGNIGPSVNLVPPPGVSQYEWDRLNRELNPNRPTVNENN